MRLPVQVVEHPLTTADGRVLAGFRFVPDGPVRAPVALLPAFAVKQRYYRRFATWLAERGFEVLTFDNRGIGASRVGHPREERVGVTEWGTLDHAAALSWLAEQRGPKLAVGHSFGGQVVGLTDAARTIDGLYGVACQLGYWGHFDGFERHRMRFLFRVAMPTVSRVWGYFPSWAGLGEDVPPNVMIEWSRWLSSPNYLLDHVPEAAARFRAFPGQFASLGFTDDTYAPPRGVQALAACFDPARTDLRVLAPADVGLPKVDHFGFFRPEGQATLWPDALRHLERWAG